MANIAIFDLDYTLTKRGTWGRFVLKNIRSRPHHWLPFAFGTAKAQLRYIQGKTSRVCVKQEMMRWSMVGARKEDIIRMAEEFADKEIRDGLRPGAWKALEQHRANGDEIVIASAAVCVIVDAIARRLNVPHWVSTEMKWEDGRLAADFETENCYGPAKLTRVKSLFAQYPELKQNHTVITMYSDSYSDIEILRYSDKAVAVNADAKLKRAARTEGFELVNWGS
jgi:HAD superfamily hydrolase (TIGR01490 family)